MFCGLEKMNRQVYRITCGTYLALLAGIMVRLPYQPENHDR